MDGYDLAASFGSGSLQNFNEGVTGAEASQSSTKGGYLLSSLV